jgi:hypothetical protein
VVLDANVIYSEIARTTYLHAHLRGACRVHWSTRILDETFTALARNYGSAEKFERVRLLMLAAVPQAARDAVDLPYGASLPHPNDAHVIGTAMACEADWIATFNLKHFPNAVLKPMGIRAEPSRHRASRVSPASAQCCGRDTRRAHRGACHRSGIAGNRTQASANASNRTRAGAAGKVDRSLSR